MKLLILFIFIFNATSLLAQNNVITYTASKKLPGTTNDIKPGFHKENFSCKLKSHVFSKGKGVITFSEDVKDIGYKAFIECSGLTSISLPQSVESISELSIYGCSSLTSFTIPPSVRNIGRCAFGMCGSLISITIPPSVTEIGKGAFSCTNLASITIPPSVTKISDETFYYCMSLTSVTIPSSVTEIGKQAFICCTNLTSITIPPSVKKIGDEAFRDCKGLTYISIPSSVTEIGIDAFRGCTKAIIYVPEMDLVRFKSMGALSELVVKAVESDQNLPKSNNNYIVTSDPPLLALEDGSLQLVESNANRTIDANEACKIRFKVINKSKGIAKGCVAKITGTGTMSGLSFGNVRLSDIAPNATQTVEIPVTADMNTQDGQVTFTIEVVEPNGFGVDPMTLAVNTRSYDAPLLKVVDYAVSGDGTLKKKSPFDLQLLLQNTKYGKAEDVDLTITLPSGVMMLDGEGKQHYAEIAGGEIQQINYQLIVSGNYQSPTVPIHVAIKEKYCRYAEDRTINLELNQQLTSAASVVLQGEGRNMQQNEIEIASIGSAVDKDIPVTADNNANTFAVIIGNENYQKVSKVQYANNDAQVFAQYCIKTLGMPEKNVRIYSDATYATMLAAIDDIKSIAKAYKGDLNVVFYYAGHGVPNESSNDAFLLPIDTDGRNTDVCYPLSKAYQELGAMNAKSVVVFMDACFSGSQRGEGMLASARGVAIKAKPASPQGNMVVFSAASGDETAYPYKEKGHGLFTYFLLKKLQETKGSVTLGELGNYIVDKVAKESVVSNGKSQTPTISPSTSLSDSWKSLKLK